MGCPRFRRSLLPLLLVSAAFSCSPSPGKITASLTGADQIPGITAFVFIAQPEGNPGSLLIPRDCVNEQVDPHCFVGNGCADKLSKETTFELDIPFRYKDLEFQDGGAFTLTACALDADYNPIGAGHVQVTNTSGAPVDPISLGTTDLTPCAFLQTGKCPS